MSLDDLFKPRVHCIVVQHDPWCPMSYGEGTTCAPGCNPTVALMGRGEFAKMVARDLRNRAERRAATKKKGKP